MRKTCIRRIQGRIELKIPLASGKTPTVSLGGRPVRAIRAQKNLDKLSPEKTGERLIAPSSLPNGGLRSRGKRFRGTIQSNSLKQAASQGSTAC